MLQIQRIRQEPEAIIEGLKKRGIDASETVHALIENSLMDILASQQTSHSWH